MKRDKIKTLTWANSDVHDSGSYHDVYPLYPIPGVQVHMPTRAMPPYTPPHLLGWPGA